jgi:hypothetical protein
LGGIQFYLWQGKVFSLFSLAVNAVLKPRLKGFYCGRVLGAVTDITLKVIPLFPENQFQLSLLHEDDCHDTGALCRHPFSGQTDAGAR